MLRSTWPSPWRFPRTLLPCSSEGPGLSSVKLMTNSVDGQGVSSLGHDTRYMSVPSARVIESQKDADKAEDSTPQESKKGRSDSPSTGKLDSAMENYWKKSDETKSGASGGGTGNGLSAAGNEEDGAV